MSRRIAERNKLAERNKAEIARREGRQQKIRPAKKRPLLSISNAQWSDSDSSDEEDLLMKAKERRRKRDEEGEAKLAQMDVWINSKSSSGNKYANKKDAKDFERVKNHSLPLKHEDASLGAGKKRTSKREGGMLRMQSTTNEKPITASAMAMIGEGSQENLAASKNPHSSNEVIVLDSDDDIKVVEKRSSPANKGKKCDRDEVQYVTCNHDSRKRRYKSQEEADKVVKRMRDQGADPDGTLRSYSNERKGAYFVGNGKWKSSSKLSNNSGGNKQSSGGSGVKSKRDVDRIDTPTTTSL